jgi:DNA segregation ATPase FtsK/SpoIIIE, S-DNA-T family
MLGIFKKAATKNGPLPFSNELKAIALLALSLFLMAALLSHSAHDQSWFYFNTAAHPIRNWCGSIGACISAILFYLFGGASIILIFLCIFMFYCVTTKKTVREEWDRITAYVMLLITFSCLTALHRFDVLGSRIPGGYFGRLLGACCYTFFDTIGTYILLYSLIFGCLIIITRFSFIGLLQTAFSCISIRAVRTYFIDPLCACLILLRKPIKKMCTRTKFWISKKCFGEKPKTNFSYEASVFDASQMMDDEFWKEFQADSMLRQAQHERGVSHHERRPSAIRDPNPHSIQMPRPDALDTIPQEISDEIFENETKFEYALPSLDMFIGVDEEQNDTALIQELEKRAVTLQEKLERFEVYGKVTAIKRGPVVTLFEYQPQIDTKISKIIALEDDLALALQATSIRIIAPIPGKSVVGFEVANKNRRSVMFSQLIKSESFANTQATLPMVLGVDTIGNPVIIDLAKMPHLLIAGSTGSGKSVGLNAMLISLLCKISPDDLRLVIIDPKRLEFAPYTDIAHLLFPIVTDPKLAPSVLRWVVKQMEQRYEIMAAAGARNIHDYRKNMQMHDQSMPFIVVIIDELADLMMCSGKEVEDAIIRITQMARAAGIHLIAATQRPSVDVITGLIKVNFTSRISFRVTTKIDSRTILDCAGADKLLGRGDMLFLDSNDSLIKRIHGAYVLDKEIHQVIAHIRAQRPTDYLDLKEIHCQDRATLDSEQDEIYDQICRFLGEIDEVSISLLQRRFRIGYNRSARIIDMLEAQGLIAPSYGGKTRKVIR